MMKLNTEIHWRFENRGTSSDSVAGSGNYIELAKSLATWMAGVTMNNRIVIEVNRKPIAASHDDGLADLTRELDKLLEGQE